VAGAGTPPPPSATERLRLRLGAAGPVRPTRHHGQVSSSPGPTSTGGRPGEHRSLPVPDGLEGQRVDQALARLFGISRAVAADLADEGNVLVDGRVRGKGDRLSGGSWLEVELPPPPGEPVAPQPVAGLRVVHDDDDVVVVDKPVGVAAHGSPGWDGPTVTGGLAAAGYRISTSGAAERQGIVHRLDAATTGLMVVAKSERAYTLLKAAFKERTVDKGYAALVQGHPDPSKGTIDAPIDRHPKHDWRFAVVSGGRPSVTHYEVTEAFPAASLVDVHLETGRTHQIRVHFSALRHPCVGDVSYGADPTLSARLKLSRQWLHARELGFIHPRQGEYVSFVSEYPPDLAKALEILAA
jgi:23S rRNA pseudouridine1911/1915/1917 synthase